jgi:hypothetical protein
VCGVTLSPLRSIIYSFMSIDLGSVTVVSVEATLTPSFGSSAVPPAAYLKTTMSDLTRVFPSGVSFFSLTDPSGNPKILEGVANPGSVSGTVVSSSVWSWANSVYTGDWLSLTAAYNRSMRGPTPNQALASYTASGDLVFPVDYVNKVISYAVDASGTLYTPFVDGSVPMVVRSGTSLPVVNPLVSDRFPGFTVSSDLPAGAVGSFRYLIGQHLSDGTEVMRLLDLPAIYPLILQRAVIDASDPSGTCFQLGTSPSGWTYLRSPSGFSYLPPVLLNATVGSHTRKVNLSSRQARTLRGTLGYHVLYATASALLNRPAGDISTIFVDASSMISQLDLRVGDAIRMSLETEAAQTALLQFALLGQGTSALESLRGSGSGISTLSSFGSNSPSFQITLGSVSLNLTSLNGQVTSVTLQNMPLQVVIADLYSDPLYSHLLLYVDARIAASLTGPGATTWTDLSSRGNNLSLNACTYTASGGGAVVFDGATSSATTQAANFSGWPDSKWGTNFTAITYLTTAADGGVIFQTGRNSTDANTECVFYTNKFWDYDSGYGFNSVTPTSTAGRGTWSQVALVRSGGNAVFYLNGRRNGTAVSAVPGATYTLNDFCIGKDVRDRNSFLKADVQAMCIYDFAMSDGDLLTHYQRNVGKQWGTDWAAWGAGNATQVYNGVAASSTGSVLAAGWTNSSSFSAYSVNKTAFGLALVPSSGQDATLVSHNANGFVAWVAKTGGPGTDAYVDVIVGKDSNVYAAGNSNGATVSAYSTTGLVRSGAGSTSGYGFVSSYDQTGSVQWLATANATPGWLTLTGVSPGIDAQGAVVVGSFDGASTMTGTSPGPTGSASSGGVQTALRFGLGAETGLAINFDRNGGVTWTARVGHVSGRTRLNAVCQTSDGGYVCSGETEATLLQSFNADNADGTMSALGANTSGLPTGKKGFVVKYNSQGGVLWQAIASGGQSGSMMSCVSITSAPGGGSCVIGTCTLDPSATRTLGFTNGDGSSATADTQVVFPTGAAGTTGTFVAMFGYLGQLIWASRIDAFTGTGISLDANGNVYCTGSAKGNFGVYSSAGTSFSAVQPLATNGYTTCGAVVTLDSAGNGVGVSWTKDTTGGGRLTGVCMTNAGEGNARVCVVGAAVAGFIAQDASGNTVGNGVASAGTTMAVLVQKTM